MEQNWDNKLEFPKHSFWRDVFRYWCEVNQDVYPLREQEIQRQCIWLNSLIKSNNMVLQNEFLFNKGIKYVS